MDDIAPVLLERIRAEFLRQLGDAALEKKNYIGAAEYADKVGDALAEAFRRCLDGKALPDGRMYWNIADRVIRPMLEEDHALVSAAAAEAQQALNVAAGLGLKAQAAPLDEDKVYGIINKVAEAEHFDDVAWVLQEPVRTFSRSVVDDTLRRNAEFQWKAGLTPRIVRRAEGRCCSWCSKLAGTYTYPDVPQDVYRRHERCRCTVEYEPGDGRRQDVWSKRWTDPDERDKIENRKTLGRSLVPLDNDKYTMPEEKLSQYLLKPGAEHAEEFFAVGYHPGDGHILNADIYAQFDPAKFTGKRNTVYGSLYSQFVQLGVTSKKPFITVWIYKTSSDKPQFVTAYRKGQK